MNAGLLIDDLVHRTQQSLNAAIQLAELPLKVLNQRPQPGAWNALECIEHLNLYGDYYLPEIESRISGSRFPADENFRSGLIGNYFAKMMLPSKGAKMKTFKDKDPIGKVLDNSVLDRFLHQQKQLLDLLEKARNVSLGKTKTGISISPWITLKLGDTFRVVIYHNQRHMEQAGKAVQQALELTPSPAM